MRLQSIQNADIIILSESILESIRHLAEDTTRDSDKAYQAILNQIFEGKLRCGQPIRDSRLQEELRSLICTDSRIALFDVFCADLRFHAMLGELSGDNILADILRKLEIMSSMALISHAKAYYQNEGAVKNEYFEIFRHIREHDRDALEEAIKRHIPRYVLQLS